MKWLRFSYKWSMPKAVPTMENLAQVRKDGIYDLRCLCSGQLVRMASQISEFDFG